MSENGPEEASVPESRSTARRPVSKFWCWTLNNPTDGEISALTTALQTAEIRYAVYQHEIGDGGTHHLQGYTELWCARGLGVMRLLLPRAHLEIRRGSRLQARTYCTKESTRAPGTSPVEFGTFEDHSQGARNDIRNVCESLRTRKVRDVILDYPETYAKYPRFFTEYKRVVTPPRDWVTKVFVFVGTTGTGKTRGAHLLWSDVWTKPPGVWYDTYDSEPHVLIDDFDGRDITFRFLLQLLDRYPLLVPVKGAFVPWVPRVIVITSNLGVDEWYNRDDPTLNAPLHRRITRVIDFPITPPALKHIVFDDSLEHSSSFVNALVNQQI